ncbi:MAG: hypothetical protein WKF95_15930 [Rubrobacter sp.]
MAGGCEILPLVEIVERGEMAKETLCAYGIEIGAGARGSSS